VAARRDISKAAPVVGVEGAWKRFRVPHERRHTLKERVLRPRLRAGADEFLALRDVSFNVRKGEFFGIVGRNGSGKSTLLKCLAGIYRLDGGRIVIDGRMSTFIELGVGFNPDLAAEDNVVTNGIMLGLTPREARRRYREIIEFAELEDYTELKLKNYSSGMQVRLAFSVAVQVQTDILLVDEVLAVGDAAFQQKCFDVFNRMRDEGRTVLFVSHDMTTVARMCDRAILLEQGEMVAQGPAPQVAPKYLELNFPADEGRPEDAAGDDGADGEGSAGPSRDRRRSTLELLDVWAEDDDGRRVNAVVQHRTHRFRFDVRVLQEVKDPAFTFLFVDEAHQVMSVTSTAFDRDRGGVWPAGSVARVSVEVEVIFRPARYGCTVIAAHRHRDHDLIERWDEALSIVVTGHGALGGVVDQRQPMTVERLGERVSVAEPRG
jgi:ABC-type polysaccharide/polyol phosphate transport system ATPase subunit